jgi:hypothetical protein
MKKMLTVIVLVFLTSGAHADSGEVRFLLSGLTPLSTADNWDSAYGFDVEFVNWLSPAVGLAAVAGTSQWHAREVELRDYYAGSDTSVTARIDGDATVCPVGLSVLLRPVVNRTAEVTLEAGARYAMVNSNVTARYEINGPSGTVHEEDRIDINDGFYGLIAMDIAFPLSPYTKISLGAGYQFDLSNGNAEYNDTDIGDSDFQASIVRIGFNARF